MNMLKASLLNWTPSAGEQGATRLTDFDAKGNFRRENGNPFPMQTDHHQHSQLRAKMLHAPRLDVQEVSKGLVNGS